MPNDYIVLLDENGQPYIEHALWGRVSSAASRVGSAAKSAYQTANKGVGRGVREVHKYLLKVGEGAKAQYAYTQAEVDALLGRGRQAVGQAIDKAKQTTTNVAQKGRQALATTSSKARDYSSRASSAIQRHGSETLKSIRDIAAKARDKTDYAIDKAKDVATKATDKVRDVAGYDKFEQYEKAWDRTSEAKDRLANNPNSAYAQREVDRAEEAEAKAHKEYLKTPLGRIRDAASLIQEQVKNIDPRIKISGNKLVLPDGAEIRIPEKFIKEKEIPEAFINEQIIKEQRIKEKRR